MITGASTSSTMRLDDVLVTGLEALDPLNFLADNCRSRCGLAGGPTFRFPRLTAEEPESTRVGPRAVCRDKYEDERL